MKIRNDVMRASVLDQLPELAGLSYEAALEKAGLNYIVSKKPLTFQKNGVETETPWHVQIVRDDTGEPLGVVRKTFGLVQIADAYEVIKELVADGNSMLSGGPVNHGERTYMLLRGCDEIIMDPEAKMFCLIAVANSYNGSESLTAHITAFRTDNGVVLNTGTAIKLRHSKHVLTRLGEAKRIISVAAESWTRFRSVYDRLTKIVITQDQAKTYFLSLLPGREDTKSKKAANIRERMFKLYMGAGIGSCLPIAKGTLWGAYQAAVEDCEYHRTMRKSKIRDQESQEIYSRLQGDAARQKAMAYSTAVTMANKFGAFLRAANS